VEVGKTPIDIHTYSRASRLLDISSARLEQGFNISPLYVGFHWIGADGFKCFSVVAIHGHMIPFFSHKSIGILLFYLTIIQFLILLIFAEIFGFRVNLTASLPLGLYRITDEVPSRGDMAFFCLESEFRGLATERGYVGPGTCPGGLRALGKTIAGLPGDLVGIETDGSISINDQILPGSAAKVCDSRGRAMPRSQLRPGIIPPGQALMLSLHHPGSFDGRYFGLVRLADLHLIRPVFTIKEAP
jgi:conjugative transfer signal peptidase TraF